MLAHSMYLAYVVRTLSHAKSLFGNTKLDLFDLKLHLSQILPLLSEVICPVNLPN